MQKLLCKIVRLVYTIWFINIETVRFVFPTVSDMIWVNKRIDVKIFLHLS